MENEITPFRVSKRMPWSYFGAFALLAAGIIAVGSFNLKNQYDKSRRTAENEMSSIGDLKTSQIDKWYSDQLEHASYLYESPLLSGYLINIAGNPSDAEIKDKIAKCLESIRLNFKYNRVLLFDSSRKLVFAAPMEKNWVGPTSEKVMGEALTAKKIMISDLHLSKMVPGTVDMDIFIPLVPQEGDSQKEPVGVVMLEINPHDFLFPLIQSWPTSSRSAESLLIRREGDEVVFLNELRHRNGTALKLRYSIDEKANLPAIMAVLGKKGVLEGIDYRGIPVIADLDAVPGTPWFIVAKVDRDEIFDPVKRQAGVILALMLMLVLTTALGVGFLWKRNDAQWLRKSHDELERRVKERTAELAAVNRELEAFSYSVSHDLKAPLRSVDGFARILEEDFAGKFDDEGRRLLKVIRDSAKDMGQLIGDLLEFSRLSRKELHKTAIDMNEMVKEVYSQMSNDLKGRIVNLETISLPEVYGDPAMIREVMVNLLSNAFKFTRTRKVSTVKVEGKIEGDEIIVQVHDNGVGYDMAYGDKLFCVFQRLHSVIEFEGTGIGLALVQRIIQRHGGRVWAEGKVGEGAVFSFSLPIK